MSARGKREDVHRRLEERYRRLADARRIRPSAAVAARFIEIDGAMLGALVSIQLFTTVIPLIIIGFDYFSGFAENASPGTLLIRELGLAYPLTERVRAAFGDSLAFRSSWTFIGVAGFLVWGIPMSITIAGIFAKAWRREQFGLGQRLRRGAPGGLVSALQLTVLKLCSWIRQARNTTRRHGEIDQLDLVRQQPTVLLEGVLLDRQPLDLSVVTDGEDRDAAQGDLLSIWFGAEEAVVRAHQHPSRCDAGALLILECLASVDFQVIDLVEEFFDPVLEVVFSGALLPATREDDVICDELVHRVEVMCVPHLVP
jgi:hypothetical protein